MKSDIVRRGEKANPEAFMADASRLTVVDTECFDKFWEMYRVGIQHFLQPKNFESKGVRYGWSISADIPAMPYYLLQEKTVKLIAFNP